MKLPKSKVDVYTVRARVIPALLVALPAGLATLAWFPGGLTGWGSLAALLVWSGTTLVLGQLGRDAGRRKQEGLFKSWGGPPTTRMLRHRDAQNAVMLDRWHRRLKTLMKTIKLPTAEGEQADPLRADEAYEACGAFLREKTRDKKLFPLVFDENCSYGFRRNLWGMKPIGLTIAIVALLAIGAVPFVEPSVWSTDARRWLLTLAFIDVLILLGWVFVVTPRWVQVTADAYAVRVLESIERL